MAFGLVDQKPEAGSIKSKGSIGKRTNARVDSQGSELCIEVEEEYRTGNREKKDRNQKLRFESDKNEGLNFKNMRFGRIKIRRITTGSNGQHAAVMPFAGVSQFGVVPMQRSRRPVSPFIPALYGPEDKNQKSEVKKSGK